MNIHEYQAKQLLSQHGVTVPQGEVCSTADEVIGAAQKLLSGGATKVVVKAQTHAGGRGKGVFKSGFKGGVKICRSAEEAFDAGRGMLGQVLVTKQTGAQGRLVSKVLVAAYSDIKHEFYLAVLMDRATSRPMVMVSMDGGVDIEEVAAKSPHKILRETIDPALGMMPYQARKLAAAMGLKGELFTPAVKLLLGVYQTWWECDATMVEVNPLGLVVASDGKETLSAVDAKISIDDNALYRHPEVQAMRDFAEEEPLEIEASNYGLSYIKLDGNIACLVNGAGLAMATMDIIKHFGGEPANFLDVGGGASRDQVTAAFRIILSDPNVRAILVNIFGGIMQCDVIAEGIVAAARETRLEIPLVVRLEGNNADVGGRILKESGLPIITGDSMSEAARKVVKAAAQASEVLV